MNVHRILADRRARNMAQFEYDESKHPRDNNGRWAGGPETSREGHAGAHLSILHGGAETLVRSARSKDSSLKQLVGHLNSNGGSISSIVKGAGDWIAKGTLGGKSFHVRIRQDSAAKGTYKPGGRL